MSSPARLQYTSLFATVLCTVAFFGLGGWNEASANELRIGGYLAEIELVEPSSLVALGDAGDVRPESVQRSSMGFTPRFGAALFATEGSRAEAALTLAPSLRGATSQTDTTRAVGVRGEVAGVDLGLTTSARMVEQDGAGPGAGSVYHVAGALTVSDFQIGAAMQRIESPFTGGEVVSAGLAYGLGSLTTRIGVERLTPEFSPAISVYSLGADLALRPGFAVQGGFSLADPVEGEPSTTGLVGLRLNF
ncbi:hypothetical protein [Marinivivus vitaminiproducens]|uniref:hypothetical protein n=1 Tax=Marinivivus vitaminiproducens TaxID=3035935 RepID=UPI0027A87730|nr:hypothetical protein P4R82_18990 [Geminicoccaceae bacterium SCSIO 64248]